MRVWSSFRLHLQRTALRVRRWWLIWWHQVDPDELDPLDPWRPAIVHAQGRHLDETQCARPIRAGETVSVFGRDTTCPDCIQRLMDRQDAGEPWPMLDPPPS